MVPAEIPMAVPGSTRAAAASAIDSFSPCWRADLAANPGSNIALPGRAVAPPWTFSRRPWSWRISRSRRMVMSETPSSRTRSATRTPPSSRTRSRMYACRWRASTPTLRRPNRRPSRSRASAAIRRVACQIAPRTYTSQRTRPSYPHGCRNSLDIGAPAEPQSVRLCRFLLVVDQDAEHCTGGDRWWHPPRALAWRSGASRSEPRPSCCSPRVARPAARRQPRSAAAAAPAATPAPPLKYTSGPATAGAPGHDDDPLERARDGAGRIRQGDGRLLHHEDRGPGRGLDHEITTTSRTSSTRSCRARPTTS